MTIRGPRDRWITACLARRVTAVMRLPVRVRSRRSFDTPRSTSVLASAARRMVRPPSRGASSRTMVSTSGSSGTGQLPPRDVTTPGLAGETDALARRAARSGGGGDGGPERGDGEHAPAFHPKSAPVVTGGARVKHQDPLAQVVGEDDLGAGLGGVRIAARR